MKIELPFERNTAYISGFSSGRNIHFLQKSTIQFTWGNTVSLGKKTIYVRSRSIRNIVFLENFGLAGERNTCDLNPLWSGWIIHFMKNALLKWNGDNHISYGEMQSVWDAGVFCTLFANENWVSLWNSGLSSGTNIHIVQNSSSSELKKLCISWKKTIYVRRSSVWHIISMGDFS
jgi:hypothetical protein